MEKKQLAEIGHRLRQKRTELGLTREEFSEIAGISTGYFSQLECGNSQMSIDTLVKLSRSMHLPLEYILFGTDYKPGNPDPVIELLNNCDEREIKLAKKVLKLFLMKND